MVIPSALFLQWPHCTGSWSLRWSCAKTRLHVPQESHDTLWGGRPHTNQSPCSTLDRLTTISSLQSDAVCKLTQLRSLLYLTPRTPLSPNHAGVQGEPLSAGCGGSSHPHSLSLLPYATSNSQDTLHQFWPTATLNTTEPLWRDSASPEKSSLTSTQPRHQSFSNRKLSTQHGVGKAPPLWT